MAPAPENPVSVPPPTTTVAGSITIGSEAVNVIVAVSPALSADLSLVILSVGRRVSITIAGAMAPATFGLPAVSVNLPAVTAAVPLRVDDALGVNVAVYTLPAPANAESTPPATVTSAATKFADGSESVKVSVAVSPALSLALSEAMATDGATVSTAIGGARSPASLPMPLESVKAPAATETVPGPVYPACGLKVAL